MKKFLIAAATSFLIFGGQADASAVENFDAQIETNDNYTPVSSRYERERRYREDYYRYNPPRERRYGYGGDSDRERRYGYGGDSDRNRRYGYGGDDDRNRRYGYGGNSDRERRYGYGGDDDRKRYGYGGWIRR